MDSRDDAQRIEEELLSKFSLRPRMARTPPGGGPASAPPNVSATVFNFGAEDGQDTPKRSRDASSPRISIEAATKKQRTQRSLVEISEELGGLIDYLIKNFKPKAVRHITQANRESFARMKDLQSEISARLEPSTRSEDEEPNVSQVRGVLSDMATQTSPTMKRAETAAPSPRQTKEPNVTQVRGVLSEMATQTSPTKKRAPSPRQINRAGGFQPSAVASLQSSRIKQESNEGKVPMPHQKETPKVQKLIIKRVICGGQERM